MKIIRKFLLFNFILILCTSCSTVKEGFTNPKKNNSDEFLVQKKSPLVMPPSYGELPSPLSKETLEDDKNNIKNLIEKSKDQTSQNNNSNNENKTLENSILGKIKNN
jgi:hypothetical protein